MVEWSVQVHHSDVRGVLLWERSDLLLWERGILIFPHFTWVVHDLPSFILTSPFCHTLL
jgi:hypothetical protein